MFEPNPPFIPLDIVPRNVRVFNIHTNTFLFVERHEFEDGTDLVVVGVFDTLTYFESVHGCTPLCDVRIIGSQRGVVNGQEEKLSSSNTTSNSLPKC
ncbi:hypothetical protein D3C80_1737470 [compost metagenome]